MEIMKRKGNDLLGCILDNVNEGIAVADDSGTITMCNKKFRDIFGITEKEIIGSAMGSVVPDMEMSEENRCIEFGLWNSEIKVAVRKKPLIIDGSVMEVFFVAEKCVDKELQIEFQHLQKEKEIFEEILNSIDEGIHLADRNGYMRFINHVQEEIDGYKSEEIVGKHWLDVYDLNSETSLILKVLRDGEPILNQRQTYVATNEKYVDVVCSCIPLYVKDNVIGAFAITKDYKKYKEIAEKVLDIQSDLEYGESARKQETKTEKLYSFEDILGTSPHILESKERANAAARSDSSVLIFGETGTGKEMFAQSIHANSRRAKKSFMAINCAAIPENLLEGILFGTTKGIYTGAIDRKGLLEQLQGGTLFLDEINSMPRFLQSKLLRVIEEKKITRLGDNKEIAIDVRFISSCNLDPNMEIEKGVLRSDLFYRLAAIYLTIPPLRNHKEDLKILYKHFIRVYNDKMNKSVEELSPKILDRFYDYHWPGNIRQLKHCIESAMNMVGDSDRVIEFQYIPKYLQIYSMTNSAAKIESGDETTHIVQEIENEEKQRIIVAIKRNKGNVAKAARELGMSRQKLHYRLTKYGLK